MLWFLYNVLFVIGFTLMLPHFLYRMWRRGGYRRGFAQRLGVYDPELRKRLLAQRRVWVHAVSVGEVFVAQRFMKEFRARHPGTSFVLTTTTSTGHAVAERTLPAEDLLLYFPVDVPIVMRRVFATLRPTALVLTECELWPNLIRQAHARGIPIFLINGRISARSYRGYHAARLFFRRIVNLLEVLCAQSAEDARRLVGLGAAPERVMVAGTAKYDVAQADPRDAERAAALLRSLGVPPDAALVVGGSTWPGEETALLDLLKEWQATVPGLTLVLAPRHAERCGEVAAEIRAHGFQMVRRSELERPGFAAAVRPEVVLVDTTGELRIFYACATAIFVGKSLTRHGGQNIIEAAVYGKPVVVGPNMENFLGVMDDFLRAQAIMQVRDAAELAAAFRSLLQDEALRAGYGERARRLVAEQRGALRRSVDAMDRAAAGRSRG